MNTLRTARVETCGLCGDTYTEYERHTCDEGKAPLVGVKCTCGHVWEGHWRQVEPGLVHPAGGCGSCGCGCVQFSTTHRNILHERYDALSAQSADDALRLGAEGDEEAAIRAAELADNYAHMARDARWGRIA